MCVFVCVRACVNLFGCLLGLCAFRMAPFLMHGQCVYLVLFLS